MNSISAEVVALFGYGINVALFDAAMAADEHYTASIRKHIGRRAARWTVDDARAPEPVKQAYQAKRAADEVWRAEILRHQTSRSMSERAALQ